MTDESRRIVRGCWVWAKGFGDAVVTAVRDDGWLWIRYVAVSEWDSKIWPASAVLASEATFLRGPDDESRVILAKRGAYGTDLVDPRDAECEALREQLEDARARQRAAEVQAEHFKAEGVFQERRAQRAEERAARLEDQTRVSGHLWRERAHAFAVNNRVPDAMLGGLRREQIIAWLAMNGWANTAEWSRSGADSAVMWRALPRDNRGVEVWNCDDLYRLSDTVCTIAHHFKLPQWDVLDQMLVIAVDSPGTTP
jgi:hypothetical protein